MAAIISTLKRVFRYGGMSLDDLYPEIQEPKEALLQGYGTQYPELRFCEMGIGNDVDGKLEFEIIKKALGTKG